MALLARARRLGLPLALPPRPAGAGALRHLRARAALRTCLSAGSAPPGWSPCWGRPPRARARWAWSWRRRLGGEILCCDSVQVYRGLDIGTGQADPGGAGPGRPPPARPGRSRTSRSTPPAGPREARAALAGRRPPAAGCRSSSGAPASTSGRCVRGLFDAPPPDPAIRRAAPGTRPRAEGVAALHRRLAAVDPEAAAPHPAAATCCASAARWRSSSRPASPLTALHRAAPPARAADAASPSSSTRRRPSCAPGSRRGSMP